MTNTEELTVATAQENTPLFDGLVVEKGFDPDATANLSITRLNSKEQRKIMVASKRLTDQVWNNICHEWGQNKQAKDVENSEEVVIEQTEKIVS